MEPRLAHDGQSGAAFRVWGKRIHGFFDERKYEGYKRSTARFELLFCILGYFGLL